MSTKTKMADAAVTVNETATAAAQQGFEHTVTAASAILVLVDIVVALVGTIASEPQPVGGDLPVVRLHFRSVLLQRRKPDIGASDLPIK